MAIDFFVNLMRDIQSAQSQVINTAKEREIQTIRIESIALRIFGCGVILFGLHNLNSILKGSPDFFNLGYSLFSMVIGYDSAIIGRNRGDMIARLVPKVTQNDTIGSAIAKGVSFVEEAVKNVQDPNYLYRDTLIANHINTAWNKPR